ncbi:hypothetical protein MKQ70_33500 [Chitinophaga sedimenti]|nr:FtsL-like putative cell division protein [Chitinophaga sedimenti]MCK7559604.1 hypothetical protein [Chitinophaga sedimenti]
MLQEEEKHIDTAPEPVEPKPTDMPPEPDTRKEWRLRINYRLITQNLPFILFLSVLALVYIANSHLAEKRSGGSTNSAGKSNQS